MLASPREWRTIRPRTFQTKATTKPIRVDGTDNSTKLLSLSITSLNPTSSSGGGGQCGWEYIEHYDLEIGYYEEIVPPAYYAWRR